MANRGRARQNDDWDMKEDDTYEPQYNTDDDTSSGVHLDHCKLYITNIPVGLSEAGLEAAFAKYGQITQAFICKNSVKNFGMVGYETPGEAKLAMMKLNRTEPLGLNVAIAHKRKTPRESRDGRESRETRDSTETRINGNKDTRASSSRETSLASRFNKKVEMTNGDIEADLMPETIGVDEDAEDDTQLDLQLEQLNLQHLRLQEAQLQCRQRMLLLRRGRTHAATPGGRCILPDGRIVVNNNNAERSLDADNLHAAAGDSLLNGHHPVPMYMLNACHRKAWEGVSSAAGSTTASTCILCSDGRCPKRKDKSNPHSRHKGRTSASRSTTASKKSVKDCKSECTSKKLDNCVARNKSDVTCDFKHGDFYSDSGDEDETNRLIQLRNSDYMDIVDERLKVVIALAGYPKSKMRLRQMSEFQKCLTDVIEMQLKAGLLKKVPTFFDYYLNRGAIVCICKDDDTKDWMVRISPGMQERMGNNIILLQAKVKRLCLAVLKIPNCSWPASAVDAFKLLQYFNPTLRTELWKIYEQKVVDGVQCTSFLIDRVSGEIIRGLNFKNVIDYDQIDFELTGYTEIYYECLLSDSDEDLSNEESRGKLDERKSEETTPRNGSASTLSSKVKQVVESDETVIDDANLKKTRDVGAETDMIDFDDVSEHERKFKSELESVLQNEVLNKFKDVTYVSDNGEVLVWNDDYHNCHADNEIDNLEISHRDNDNVLTSQCTVAMSDNTESLMGSNDNLIIGRSSNLNIDSNRGIAYHRRTNYLHVENELKVAITLEGYPQNKLEGTHIRRLKHLFKEYLHKDMKMQRFTNLIIPKFQDIYLSNGAVIYICDSLETKDYLTEVLPKFVNSTGLKLTFQNIKNLVRYTRIVMRLPKELAHVESLEIITKLQAVYTGLKPDCWKFYSDVAGKQKRQFGVERESLEVIKSPNFDPIYEGHKISFRIIDRQKRDSEESNIIDVDIESVEAKKQRDKVLNAMYVPIDSDVMKAPLTRVRTNHYTDLIADDLKLYVGPSNYPESRIEDTLFHSIKRALESIVFKGVGKREISEVFIPKFHDMYLFDGVIFIISYDLDSKNWVTGVLGTVNSKLRINLKYTEFRGAVGIISMVIKTDKETDDVIAALQNQNPRLRTKYWRKISTVHTKNKLDAVLQIDKLSAQVITSPDFNKYVDGHLVHFRLGHLQSLLKPKASLEDLLKVKGRARNDSAKKTRSKLSMKVPKDVTIDEIKTDLSKEYPDLNPEDWNVTGQIEKAEHKVCNLEVDEKSAKVIEKQDFKLTIGHNKLFFYTGITDAMPIDAILSPESPNSFRNDLAIPIQCNDGFSKVILKIPSCIVPENKEDLNIIFDLLQDKNPGLNTELWQLENAAEYPNNGKFLVTLDKQSASIIQSASFDPTIGGERVKFYF